MTALTKLLMPLQQAWRAREPRERRTLTLGGVLIILMLAYLAVTRPGGSDTTIQPPAAYHHEHYLPPILKLEEDAWRTAAERHGITLERLVTDIGGLQLEGRTVQPEAAMGFARWAARHGWWTTDWALSRDTEEGLKLRMVFMAELERLPDSDASQP